MSDSPPFEILLIEDEAAQSAYLVQLIQNTYPDIPIKTTDNLGDTEKILNEFSPGLILADIQIGNQTIFEIFPKIKAYKYQIIFITAHDKYHVKALEWYGLDFITKPVDESRLFRGIEVARERYLQGNYTLPNLSILQQDLQKSEYTHLALPMSNGHRIVLISDIIAVEADRSYCLVYLKDNSKQVLSKSLSWMEDKLKEKGFIRTHRSWLVNPIHIFEFIKGNSPELKMSSGLLVAVAESMRIKVWNKLKTFTHLE